MSDLKKMFFRPKGVNLYLNATSIYSIRKLIPSFSDAVVRIERSSDSATAWVFFDGNEITLNSLISTVSNTTPSATTLSTWIGSDTGRVLNWYNQINSLISVSYTVGSKPTLLTGGVLNTKNSRVCISFNGSSGLRGSSDSSINSANNYTILTVSSNDTSNGIGTIFSNTISTSARLALFSDRRTIKRNGFIENSSGTSYEVDNILQDDTANQKLQSFIADSSRNMTAYKDGALQSTNTYTLSYGNNTFRIGYQFNDQTGLNGDIQEVIVLPIDLTSAISEYHNDINNYYSIY